MVKRMSSAAVVALKEALATIYWYKDGFKSFVTTTIGKQINLAQFDWTRPKRQVASELVDTLTSDEQWVSTLTRLSMEVCAMTDFSHLERLDDGKNKADAARKAVAALRKLLSTHVDIESERKQQQDRQKGAERRAADAASFDGRLRAIKDDFAALLKQKTPQSRGYYLEKILRDLFELYDLDPKASFRNTGEQIDGAFCFESTEYLLEAKWQEKWSDASDLDSFAAKIRRHLENTLGLFISINGFSPDGIEAHERGGVISLLLDGQDLAAVLEGRIPLPDLLRRKKQHAARKGGGFLPVYQILG
ncbi:MAG TPA: hypothetical protein VHY48_04490 [Acidobacteriaceae bacterium]|jgi:hypothetical protein|nr:hypothetical protein [Acidobacteriaceae bacterium]